ncbi:MAG: ABC transporter permease [Pseudonocardiaceae bacterium]|nr:ABC transporter permease [Pseudonocardiaceae bacterium]
MGGAVAEPGIRLAVVAVALVVLGAAVSAAGRLGHAGGIVRAALRAAVQLAAVSALIAVVLTRLGTAAAFVALMLAVAVVTSARRSRAGRSGAWVGLALAGGAMPVLILVLASGVVPLRGVSVVPIGGIVIGGAMTATTLAARRALDAVADRHGEVEAAMAVGLTDRDARREVARPAAADALLPALDQTRTVGLVTLPGAFVGMLLGGATAVQAGSVQLLVLVALLAAQAIAVVGCAELVAAGRLRRP